MEIWNYHFETGELLSQSIADQSPLEPGVYLIPAYATTVAPLELKSGKAVVFKNDAWVYENDYRGEIWWEPNGEKVVIETLGSEAIDGLLSEEPAPPPAPVRTPLTAEEKLAAAGLSVDELKSLLGIN